MRVSLAGFNSRSVAAALLCCFLGLGLGAAQELKPTPLIPDALPLPTSETAHYFVQADDDGNLVLLRGDTLETYPIQKGEPGKATRYQLAVPTSYQFSDVAMAGSGRNWALVESNQILRLKDGMSRSAPDVGWLVTSVAMVRDSLVAGVLPMSVGRTPTTGRPKSPPLIVKLGSSGWETQVNGSFPRRTSGQNPFNSLFAEHTVRLAAGAKGKLWVAYPYTGRIVRYTSAGRAELVMALGKGFPKFKDNEKELRQSLMRRLKEGGYENSRAQAGVFTAQLLVRGLAEGRDGYLYLLLDRAFNGETTLARYNDVSHVIEAVPVRFPGEDEATMAVGRDGLAWTVRGGSELWKLSWSTLEAADWKVVEDVRLLSSEPAASPTSSR